MRIERRRRYGQNLQRLMDGELVGITFEDGYHFCAVIDGAGPLIYRVAFERHEAERFAKGVIEALDSQRTALDELGHKRSAR